MILSNTSKKQKTVILKQAFSSFVVDRFDNGGKMPENKPHYYERITELIRDMPVHEDWMKEGKQRSIQVCGLVKKEDSREMLRWVLYSLDHPTYFDKYQNNDPMRQTVFPHTKI